MSKPLRRNFGQRGQVMPIVAISLLALIMFAGILVDIGRGRYEQKRAQAAVDSAAIAGANAIAAGSNSDVTLAALRDVPANGFATGTVKIQTPPKSGPNAGNTSAIEADLTTTIPTTLGRLFNVQSLPIHARAVARAAPSLPCFTVLNKGMYGTNPAMTINAGTNIDMPNCEIHDNGDLLVNGSATATDFGIPDTWINAKEYNYSGAIQNPQQVLWTTRGYVPATKAPPVPDPCLTSPICNTFPPCTGPSGRNQTVVTNILPGGTVPDGCFPYGMNVSTNGDQSKIGKGTATFCGAYWITGGMTTYVENLSTCAGGASFYVDGGVELSSPYIDLTNMSGKPLFYVKTGSFNLNESLVKVDVYDEFNGMIYVPLGTLTFISGTAVFQNIDAGAVEFDGHSCGCNLWVRNTMPPSGSTKLTE